MKRALVIGASGGIGKAIFRRLHKEGFDVRTPTSSLCDVRDEHSVNRYIDMFNITNVDVLVNCSGISHLGTIDHLTKEEIHRLFDVNTMGAVRLCKAIIPIMRKQRSGYIINIGSLRGIECCEGKAAYSMSKFAVRAFSNTLGKEVRKYGIKVTCINPGFVYTKLIKERIKKEKLKPSDIIIPEDIAETVMFLLKLSKGVYIPEINLGEVWQ